MIWQIVQDWLIIHKGYRIKDTLKLLQDHADGKITKEELWLKAPATLKEIKEINRDLQARVEKIKETKETKEIEDEK